MKMESKYCIGDMVYCLNYVGDNEWVEIWKDQIESINYSVDGFSYMVMNNDSPINEDFVCREDDIVKIGTKLKNLKEPKKTLD